MHKHTLGPWKAHHKTDAHCSNRFMITGVSRHDGRIAHVADDVVEHNVPLIISAIDLLEAARAARDALAVAIRANWAGSTDNDISEHVTIKRLDRAIAKAEGIETTELKQCAA